MGKGSQQEGVALEVRHRMSDSNEHQKGGMCHVNTVLKVMVGIVGRVVPPDDGDERPYCGTVDAIADQAEAVEKTQDDVL